MVLKRAAIKFPLLTNHIIPTHTHH